MADAMNIGTRKFNWVQTPTAWQQAKSWRAQRRKVAQQFMSSGTIISTLSNAGVSEAEGNAKLAMQTAVARIKAKTAADKLADKPVVDNSALAKTPIRKAPVDKMA
jgi:hypothetical protein